MNKVVRSCFYCNIWNRCKRNKKINFLILNCSLLGLPPGFLDLSPVLLILPWLYTSKGELFFLMWLLGDCKRQSSPWAEQGESQCCCTVEFVWKRRCGAGVLLPGGCRKPCRGDCVVPAPLVPATFMSHVLLHPQRLKLNLQNVEHRFQYEHLFLTVFP